MAENVLRFEEAMGVVLAEAGGLASAGGVEAVELLEARGRVLAERVVADRDQPPFDRSTRDGYAVRTQDVSAGLKVVGAVRAGESWRGEALREGEAIEIMTGAPLPAGADAVLMVEHADLVGDVLQVHEGRELREGENVVARGAEAKNGDGLLPVGRVLDAAEIAVAASCGAARVKVFARPRVAIVATGDELVELDAEPREWEIRNSNSYALQALVAEAGGDGRRLAIARDTRADLEERIAQGSMWDMLVLSGGVSMGKYDLVEEVLGEYGAEFFFTGAKIQPGKPVVFGRLPKRGVVGEPLKSAWAGEWTYFFGLPGNPVSTQVCFHLFVAPMLRALAGRTDVAPRFVEARLAEDVKGGARVTRFLPAEIVSAWDGVSVRVVGWQGSGDVAANARGNCYAVLPSGVEGFRAGETVRVLLR
jgi:molybdopterin molybdotransferase